MKVTLSSRNVVKHASKRLSATFKKSGILKYCSVELELQFLYRKISSWNCHSCQAMTVRCFDRLHCRENYAFSDVNGNPFNL